MLVSRVAKYLLSRGRKYGLKAIAKIQKLKATSQLELLNLWLSRGSSSRVLIVLDACRFDYFINEASSLLARGKLTKAWSPASCTIDWLKICFPGFYKHVRVISAHPYLNSKGITTLGYRAVNHFLRHNIVDVWDWGWDENLKTVPPSTVYKAFKEQDDGEMKTIIWFVQPHGPWIGKTKLPIPKRSKKKLAVGAEILEKVKKGEITVSRLREAYRDNLRLVLEYVNKIVKETEGGIIITSDHGEMLGEYRLFLHPCRIECKILRLVPWLEVRGE